MWHGIGCCANIFPCFVRLALERDTSERDARDKETKILSQNRELEELMTRIEDLDRIRQQQARELDDLMSSKDDVGKNVSMIS